MHAERQFYCYCICEGEKMSKERRKKGKGEKGREVWRRDDRGADWSKGLSPPPASPSVHVRPKPFGILTLLMWEYSSQNALYLCVLQSHFMSGVHLFCIKVSGKGETGVSRLACSSLNGYHQTRAQGMAGGGMGYGWCVHILLWWRYSCTAGTTHPGLSQSQGKRKSPKWT